MKKEYNLFPTKIGKNSKKVYKLDLKSGSSSLRCNTKILVYTQMLVDV